MRCAITAEPIKMSFGFWVVGSDWSKESCITWCPNRPMRRGNFQDAIWVVDSDGPKKHVLHGGAHCHYLANTTEPSVCSGNAAFLPNYFGHLLLLLLLEHPQSKTAVDAAVIFPAAVAR